MNNEIWKDVVGYEGLYEVSNKARIRSLYRILSNGVLTKREKCYYVHQKARGRSKHLSVWLYKNGKGKHWLVHRIVALAFIPNPDNLPFINHKDENPLNNNVSINRDGTINAEKSNLEWCTAAYNNSYGTVKERISRALLNRKDLSLKIVRISFDGKRKIYPSMQEAARDNKLFQPNIWKCCNGERRTCGGYYWNYK